MAIQERYCEKIKKRKGNLMKHPFWIVNLGLLLLVLLTFAFVYLSRVKVPSRESIEPAQFIPRKERKVAINIKKIYENDLFGTYVKEIHQARPLDLTIPFPEPPKPEKISIPQPPEQEFLTPLDITLKGIIVVGTNDSKNRAIIQDNKTKQEVTYKVGDAIQDAQLMRIFRNKIILLRTNGQQEVLYLRQQDALLDPAYMLLSEWTTTIQKIEDYKYRINPNSFVEQVKNLAQFIEMVNLTTAYKMGENIGVRIGQLSTPSLGKALGLQNGDIITHVNDIQTRTTQERLSIYKMITHLNIGDTVTIHVTRKNKEIILTYVLEDFSQQEEGASKIQMASFPSHKEVTSQQKHSFAPTVDKMRKADLGMMRTQGKAPLKQTVESSNKI